MTKIAFAVVMATLLMSCGAEGDPLRPTARLGIGVGSGGVSSNVAVGLENANTSISVGASR